MRTKTIYITNDGREFANQGMAEDHEYELKGQKIDNIINFLKGFGDIPETLIESLRNGKYSTGKTSDKGNALNTLHAMLNDL